MLMKGLPVMSKMVHAYRGGFWVTLREPLGSAYKLELPFATRLPPPSPPAPVGYLQYLLSKYDRDPRLHPPCPDTLIR